MYNFKTAHPPHPGIPRAFDWNFVTYIGEFDLKWGQPSQAFHVCVYAGRDKQKDFVILSSLYRTIQHVHHLHGSLLLYSLFCRSIWEPLKKPVQCGLSRINNFLKIKKKTSVRQLSKTSDISAAFSRILKGLTNGKAFEESLVGGEFDQMFWNNVNAQEGGGMGRFGID